MKGEPWFAFVAYCTLVAGLSFPDLQRDSSSSSSNQSAIFLGPGFLTKAVNVASLERLKEGIDDFMFPTYSGTTALAPDCNFTTSMKMVVAATDFSVTAVELVAEAATTVSITFLGTQSIPMIEVPFTAACVIQGVFAKPLRLQRTGQVQYTLEFDGALVMHAQVNLDNSTGYVELVEPSVVSNLSANPVYSYDLDSQGQANGFAMDWYLANYFATDLANEVKQAFVQSILSSTGVFFSSWVPVANAALSLLPAACGSGVDPRCPGTLILFYGAPCTAPPPKSNVSYEVLLSHDVMLEYVSDRYHGDGLPVNTTHGSIKAGTSPAPSPNGELCYAADCPSTTKLPTVANFSSMELRFVGPSCRYCYPDYGAVVELAFNVTYSLLEA